MPFEDDMVETDAHHLVASPVWTSIPLVQRRSLKRP
jgi:hypothetical protein